MAAAIATGLLGSVVVVFYFFFSVGRGIPAAKRCQIAAGSCCFSPLAAKTDFLVLFMKNEAKC